ncbi:TPA: restriction endonuclease subunit S [Escherichia coli]|uniref:restriction endonuclease subunit S n=1 Tax=Escherichia coli TaxID=562 RepID=UPI0005A986DA|nr:restriction endonuclease subunit S [Escherichia coli]AKM33876.1 type I restriction modification DNA specificity domain protein [Escherichia coli PCN061]AUO35667.1 type I restriction modification DNA specificity domain protein [Escherichia coli]EFN2303482.1 restriction endonuclease subunit S [Escherichia coli]EGA0147267.1 restriction endonuclease subunit S [Escherichia coli]EGL3886657.1 restriction endonuclease subunit S [Escherichia coli]
MSELSYLEKLLDGVEVEWLPLGEVSALRRGRVMSKGYLTENFGPYPVYSSQTANNGKIGSINTFDFDGEYISWTTDGANAGTMFYRTGKFSITNVCGLITLKSKYSLIYKFLFYWLTIEAKKHVYSGMGNPKLMSHQVENIPVPIPCPDNPEKSLAIQSEIVRILDTFSALTAELTAELNMRKKQYNYYRDQLLSFNTEDVPHLPMGQKDIGEFIRGGTFQKKDFIDAGVGCIHYGQIYTYYGTYTEKTKTYISTALAKKCKKAQKGDLIIATTSENDEDVCKAVAWLGSEDIAVSSDACIYKHNLNPKYVSYFFQTEQFQNQKRQYITGAKVRRVNADNLSKILIPVPSMEIQERIVSILDKFDTLTNSITEGLPREIELRQKQYEYYRDLLFSFPKPETASN